MEICVQFVRARLLFWTLLLSTYYNDMLSVAQVRLPHVNKYLGYGHLFQVWLFVYETLNIYKSYSIYSYTYC